MASQGALLIGAGAALALGLTGGALRLGYTWGAGVEAAACARSTRDLSDRLAQVSDRGAAEEVKRLHAERQVRELLASIGDQAREDAAPGACAIPPGGVLRLDQIK